MNGTLALWYQRYEPTNKGGKASDTSTGEGGKASDTSTGEGDKASDTSTGEGGKASDTSTGEGDKASDTSTGEGGKASDTSTGEGDKASVTSTGERSDPFTIQLHVNLWRDLDKHFNFLDVGFVIEKVEYLERLYLYLPAPIDKGAIFDLGSVLKNPDTLNAVFNDVAQIITVDDDHFVVDSGPDKDGKKRLRTIHILKPEHDIAVDEVNVKGQRCGTIIALNTALCERIRNTRPGTGGDHYVRLRVYLQGDARALFTTVDTSSNLGLALTQDVLETTEFRLNERRSYPAEILRRADQGKVDLRSVYYFLIRSKDHQLASQHQNFRKVRYLEHDIWDSYIQVGLQKSDGSRESPLSAEGMIIYQWREKSEKDEPLNDFIAYASFRTARYKFRTYLLAVVAIGGIGSAVLNSVVALLAYVFTYYGCSIGKPDEVGWQNLVAGVLLSFLVALPTCVDYAYRWWQRR